MEISIKINWCILAILFSTTLAFAQDAPPPPPPPGITKEQTKQWEKDQKHLEKKQKEIAKHEAKEDTKRQKQEAETQAALEKIVPIGKDIEYDRFKDISRVTTKAMNVLSDKDANNWAQLYVAMYSEYTVQGNVGSLPETVNLVFATMGWRYFFGTSTDRTLNLIVDGSKRVPLGEMKYSGNRDTKCCREAAWVTLSLKDYQTLANSSSVEVQMGRVEFAFHPRHFEGLRALLADLPTNTSSQQSSQSNNSAQISSYSPFVGSWKLQLKMQNNETLTWTLSIKKTDDTFTGTINTVGGEIIVPNIIVANRVFGNTKVKTNDGKEGTFFIFGDFKDGNISGKITLLGAEINSTGTFEGLREGEK